MLVLSTVPDYELVASADRPFVRRVPSPGSPSTFLPDADSDSDDDVDAADNALPVTPFAFACIYGRASVVRPGEHEREGWGWGGWGVGGWGGWGVGGLGGWVWGLDGGGGWVGGWVGGCRSKIAAAHCPAVSCFGYVVLTSVLQIEVYKNAGVLATDTETDRKRLMRLYQLCVSRAYHHSAAILLECLEDERERGVPPTDPSDVEAHQAASACT